MLTLGEAAKQAGCSKSTLSRALKKGELSGTRKADESFDIDPAELQRWNGERSKRGNGNRTGTIENQGLARSLSSSETLIELGQLRAENELLRNERDDLRRRLDAESDERRKMSERLLSAPEKPMETPRLQPGWFDRLLGRKPL